MSPQDRLDRSQGHGPALSGPHCRFLDTRIETEVRESDPDYRTSRAD
jgi:hypothetical protein